MTSFCQRLEDGPRQPPSGITQVADTCLMGCVYAKFANLPVQTSMKAWFIWEAAERIFISLASTLTARPSKQSLILASVKIISLTIGLIEMQKRGLIGERMITFVGVLYRCSILCCIAQSLSYLYRVEANDTYESIAQKFGTTQDEICRLNKWKDLPELTENQSICVDSLVR
jgi:hypothetical protein